MTSSLISRMSPNNLIQFNFETDVQEAYHFLRGNISFYERKKPLKTLISTTMHVIPMLIADKAPTCIILFP